MVNDCNVPDCVICQWIADAFIRFNDSVKAAIMAAAADLEPITVTTWLPPERYRENRRLPMPLRYA